MERAANFLTRDTEVERAARSPTQTTASVFSGAGSYVGTTTLLGSLQGGGGSDTTGAARILLRAAVANLLTTTAAGGSTTGLVADVNAALASGDRATILALASQLDALNNTGDCPFD